VTERAGKPRARHKLHAQGMISCVHRIISWIYKEQSLPLQVHGSVEASPYNPQPTDRRSKKLITCTGVAEAAEGVKTFHFSCPRTENGRSAAVAYISGQFASFDIQVGQAQFMFLSNCAACQQHDRQGTHIARPYMSQNS